MANRKEKTKEQRIRAEKTRLRRIYKLLPKEAAGTVAGLIDQAAFMRIECEDMADDLRENGWTEKFQQSERLEPYDRARPIGQAYNSTNGAPAEAGHRAEAGGRRLCKLCPGA